MRALLASIVSGTLVDPFKPAGLGECDWQTMGVGSGEGGQAVAPAISA